MLPGTRVAEMDGRMTIKQLADTLGVSKTFVRKHMDDDFRLQHTETTANGVITIDQEGCKLLSETIGNRTETTENQVAETPANTGNQLLYEMLQGELDAKNRQIEKLQDELAKAQEHNREQADRIAQLANQAQQLHAGDIKRLGAAAPSEDASEPVEAFQGEEVQKPAQDPSGAQDGLLEAVKSLPLSQRIKLLIFKK